MIEQLLANPITLLCLVISLAVVVAGLVFAITSPRLFLLVIKNLRRNLVRTMLTCLATMVLVAMVTMIWTVIYTLDMVTTEKSKDFKLVVTERWQIPSQMPMTHADYVNPESPKFLPELKGMIGPNDFMTWSFYGGTLDPTKFTRENLLFMFVMNPKHIRSMMDELDTLDPALVKKLEDTRTGVLLGPERLAMINKKVGERIKVTSLNYKGINLELEIVGELPAGRYDQSAIMSDAYFNDELDKYARTTGQKHPLDNKRLNLIWLRVRDRDTFNRVGEIVENSPYFSDRPVKVETASSGIGAWLDAYRDLLWGVKWLLVPAILVSMALVVANAISISVRERYTEMAVLKVLGFRPNSILTLVLGESMLVGALAGFGAALLALLGINFALGGIKFPIAFFPAFFVPIWALAWGLAMGAGAAFLGSILPAQKACSVKVSEVFSKVA
ncbi:MAG: ABC transporter permease [Gemmataceae bacterium]|nr:ABC transporter permease [Gemmataceae bacterium]MCI0742751.1 ABC transporter permease [Gemmataceae bacterium]